MRVRGLKLVPAEEVMPPDLVAPRAGAWIETLQYDTKKSKGDVAPRAGAWIETFISVK